MRATERHIPAPLTAGIALIVVLMSALAAVRWSVWSYGTDTGTFAQIAQNAFRGFSDGPENGTHFVFHFSPVLAILYPLAAITHSPLSIQIAQVVLVALTAVPLFAIVRAYAGEEWGTRCAFLALIYPPLLSIAFEEFHELAFYPVLALGLVWAADRARWVWFAIFALLAVLVREDASAGLVVIGVVFAVVGVVRRNSRERGLLLGEPAEPERLTVAGIGLAVFAAASLAIYAFAVIPRVGHWAPSHFYDYPFAQGPVQTALAIFTHPLELARATLTFGRLTYLLEALAPLAFLPFFTRWSLLALPGLAGVLLASDSIVWRMGFHYSLLWTPWLLLAAAWVLCKLCLQGREDSAIRWWWVAMGLCAVVLIAFNPMHPAHYLRAPAVGRAPDVVRAFDCVPQRARVMTHDEWFAHVALRYPNSTNLDEQAARFPGYLVYAPDWQNAHVQQVIVPAIERAVNGGRYRTICRFGAVRVLAPTSSRRGE